MGLVYDEWNGGAVTYRKHPGVDVYPDPEGCWASILAVIAPIGGYFRYQGTAELQRQRKGWI